MLLILNPDRFAEPLLAVYRNVPGCPLLPPDPPLPPEPPLPPLDPPLPLDPPVPLDPERPEVAQDIRANVNPSISTKLISNRGLKAISGKRLGCGKDHPRGHRL